MWAPDVVQTLTDSLQIRLSGKPSPFLQGKLTTFGFESVSLFILWHPLTMFFIRSLLLFKKKKKKICRVTQQKWRPHTKLWQNFWGFIFSRSFEESLFCVQLLSIILQQTGESFRLSETQMYQNINIIQQNCGVQAAVKEWHKMKKKCKGSFGWFFNHPALPSTVPQMLSTSRE